MSPDPNTEGAMWQDTEGSIWQDTEGSIWQDTGIPLVEAINTQLHKNVLKLLSPIKLGGDFDADIELEGAHLDTAQAEAERLLIEMFPDTTVDLLSRWEEVYGIAVDESKEYYLRIQNLLAKVNAQGGLSKASVQLVLKQFLGYSPEIETYHYPRCDDPETLTDYAKYVFTDEYVYFFTVYIDNVLLISMGYSRDDVAAILDDIKPAHSDYYLDIGPGFFADDKYSLTNQTLLAI